MLGSDFGIVACLLGWLRCKEGGIVRRTCMVWCLGWRWGYDYAELNSGSGCLGADGFGYP